MPYLDPRYTSKITQIEQPRRLTPYPAESVPAVTRIDDNDFTRGVLQQLAAQGNYELYRHLVGMMEARG